MMTIHSDVNVEMFYRGDSAEFGLIGAELFQQVISDSVAENWPIRHSEGASVQHHFYGNRLARAG